MAHTYTNLLTHIIFSTKERAPLIDEEFLSFLKKHGIEYDERFIWQ
jgi:hypothetical protein